MAIKSKELKEWVVKAVEETYSDGLTRDAHIDQFTSYHTDNQKETFQKACQIINLVAKTLRYYDTKGLEVWLHLDLISSSKVLKRAPKDLTHLLSLIETNCVVPEVIVSKPDQSVVFVPSNEFYRVPIQFEIGLLENNLFVLYKEHRYDSSEKFEREMNILLTANN